MGTKYGKIHLYDIRDPTVSVGYDGSLRLWCARDRTLMHQYNVRLWK